MVELSKKKKKKNNNIDKSHVLSFAPIEKKTSVYVDLSIFWNCKRGLDLPFLC